MIRPLVTLAAGGAVVSVACLAAAIAIGGPEAATRGVWAWSPHGSIGRHATWDWDWDDDHPGARGPQSQRQLSWTGGSTLTVNAPAEVEYVQQDGPAQLTISGPASAVDAVEVAGGEISLHRRFAHQPLRIRLAAPGVNRFELNGAGGLDVSQYKQDRLAIVISGHARIAASGETKQVDLRVSGAGDADLKDLKTERADIDISGAGQAITGPTQWARVHISGVGDVKLTTHPAHLETEISGAGHIRQPGSDDPDPNPLPGDGPKRST